MGNSIIACGLTLELLTIQEIHTPLDVFASEYHEYLITNKESISIKKLPKKLERLLRKVLQCGYSYNQIADAADTDYQTIVRIVNEIEPRPWVSLPKGPEEMFPAECLAFSGRLSLDVGVGQDASKCTALTPLFPGPLMDPDQKMASEDEKIGLLFNKFSSDYKILKNSNESVWLSKEMYSDLEMLIAGGICARDIAETIGVSENIALWWIDIINFEREKKMGSTGGGTPPYCCSQNQIVTSDLEKFATACKDFDRTRPSKYSKRPDDLNEQLVNFIDDGVSPLEIANVLGQSVSNIHRRYRRFKERESRKVRAKEILHGPLE